MQRAPFHLRLQLLLAIPDFYPPRHRASLWKSRITPHKSLGKTDPFWEADPQLLRESGNAFSALEFPPGISRAAKPLASAVKPFQGILWNASLRMLFPLGFHPLILCSPSHSLIFKFRDVPLKLPSSASSSSCSFLLLPKYSSLFPGFIWHNPTHPVGFSPVPVSRTARSGIELGYAVGFGGDRVRGHTGDWNCPFRPLWGHSHGSG